jgi:hypothetical protein
MKAADKEKAAREFQEAVLAVIRRDGGLSAKEVANRLGRPLSSTAVVLGHMARNGQLAKVGSSPCLWVLKDAQIVPSGKVVGKTGFTGVDWGLSTSRPGCLDHLKCPSRRGDKLVYWQPPIINAAS